MSDVDVYEDDEVEAEPVDREVGGTEDRPSAIGAASRPEPVVAPVEAPLNVVSTRLHELDFEPVVGKTAPAPVGRFSRVSEGDGGPSEDGAPTE